MRFAAAQPNEMWQSDATHWRLADRTDVEILNWLDDHSRYLLQRPPIGPSPATTWSRSSSTSSAITARRRAR